VYVHTEFKFSEAEALSKTLPRSRAPPTGATDNNHLQELQSVEMHKSKQLAIWVRFSVGLVIQNCIPVRHVQNLSKSISQ